jgi:hypothetical protein
MTSDAWPSPDAQPGPLPRIEDLPIADQGYEQDAVRAAFASFYRHAAQLDASLRALEAVEVFRRDADALRNDLRAIRALGVGGATEPAWATQTYERPRAEVPGTVFRLLAEAALIIAVAVVAGVANLGNVAIVALMAAAFIVVAMSEWLATRARFAPPVTGFVAADLLEPAPFVEAPAPAATWGAAPPEELEEPDEETEPEALTVVGASAADPWEHAEEEDDDDAAVAGEPSERGFLRRLRR